jgi:hypothetical protein
MSQLHTILDALFVSKDFQLVRERDDKVKDRNVAAVVVEVERQLDTAPPRPATSRFDGPKAPSTGSESSGMCGEAGQDIGAIRRNTCLFMSSLCLTNSLHIHVRSTTRPQLQVELEAGIRGKHRPLFTEHLLTSSNLSYSQ